MTFQVIKFIDVLSLVNQDTAMFKIAVIVGSLRKESLNKKLFHALDKLNHTDLTFNLLNIHDLPLFNQDYEAAMPASAVNLKNEIENADGILFLTPEYNRSIPGVLKNIIDWGTRPFGKNSWAKKPAAIIGTSPGNVGTAAAQAHLRSILVAIDVILLGNPEVYLIFKDNLIDEHFAIKNDDTRKFLQYFLDEFTHWIQIHNKN